MDKYLYNNIAKITLHNELDIVMAYKRARQLCDMTGIAVPPQTKFATAVSEICRNVLEHVGNGTIEFNLLEEEGKLCLEALVSDRGRGIANVEELLQRKIAPTVGKGAGIVNSRKLVDSFLIESEIDKGTRVYLRKMLPPRHPPINKAIVQGWQGHFSREVNFSPYEELKRQNMEMLDVMEALQLKNIQTDHQLEEIKSLNQDLLKSNHEVTLLLEEREEKNQLLQKMNAQLEDFAYTVSHDLKAPLRNMEGLCKILEKVVRASENESDLFKFDMMKAQITRMDRLITGILSYSKSGRQEVEKTTVDVGALLKEVISLLAVPEGFRIHVQEPMPVLVTEETYLQQVFGNLIGNAIKYHDQPNGHIEVTCQQAGEFFQFSVSDDGPGILPLYHEKIFKIFYSIHSSANKDSTGLGLAIIKRIMEEKGGKVWVESEGRGTKFAFTWPVE